MHRGCASHFSSATFQCNCTVFRIIFVISKSPVHVVSNFSESYRPFWVRNAHRPLHPNARLSYKTTAHHLRNVSIRLAQCPRTPSCVQEQVLTFFHIVNLDLLVLPSIDLC